MAVEILRLADEAKQAAILDERNRMARDVHDTLAQAFTGVIMQLEATKRKINTAQPDAAQDHIARARSLAQAGLSEARRSVRALRPESLESNDLPDALYHLATQMTCDISAQILVEIAGRPYPLSIEVETNLLQIAQEAVTNALRHAQPQTIRLILHFASKHVDLSIVDDGQGFDPQFQMTVGFGLVGMQERSQRINGEFSLSSTIGQGTEIVVVVSR
jgi:signal transduction histidine kinase